MKKQTQTQMDFLKICKEENFLWGVQQPRIEFSPRIVEPPTMMREICRVRFGNDETAIQRHHVRYYLTECGVVIMLDRNLSFEKPIFTSCLLKIEHMGITPVLPVNGLNGWAEGRSWEAAEHLFCEALGIELVDKAKMFHTWGGSKKDDEVIQEWCDAQVNT